MFWIHVRVSLDPGHACSRSIPQHATVASWRTPHAKSLRSNVHRLEFAWWRHQWRGQPSASPARHSVVLAHPADSLSPNRHRQEPALWSVRLPISIAMHATTHESSISQQATPPQAADGESDRPMIGHRPDRVFRLVRGSQRDHRIVVEDQVATDRHHFDPTAPRPAPANHQPTSPPAPEHAQTQTTQHKTPLPHPQTPLAECNPVAIAARNVAWAMSSKTR